MLNYWERGADDTPVAQTGANNPFDGIDVGGDSHPAVADWDGDGRLDLITVVDGPEGLQVQFLVRR